MPLKDVSVTEADTVTLTCEVSKPHQKPHWLKNGTEIVPDDRVSVEVDGTIHRLSIPISEIEDSAEYTVKLGDQTSSANVAVNGESEGR